MNMNFQQISPLWGSFPAREAQPVEKKRAAEGSVFADIFQSLVNNVRESEDDVAKKEYLLSTGQLDNPAELNIALYKADVSMQLFVQLREKALNAYNEISRISL
ncbi:MAG: flagellar hook-basal body complex protein FliE [Oscillospiraceae bacterium]|jgi:flagellar hook-basal body complex protein FliE|nr:flagellar hook-basal body complex protein FliE [Oscillospiraceae bacterium]